jgi:hypothetical protein
MESEITTHLLNVCALATQPIGQYQSGDLVYIEGANTYYRFDPASGAPVDGATVVSTPKGPAQVGCTKADGTDPARWILTNISSSITGNGQVIAVANRPALAVRSLASLGDGTLAYVGQTGETYRLLLTSGAFPDGGDVVSSANGPQTPNFPPNPNAGLSPARWILLETASVFDPNAPINLATDVFIDALAGNDQNDGTALAPLATWAELVRRWQAVGSRNGGGGSPVGNQTVHLVNGLGIDDVLIVDERAPSNLTVVGTMRSAGVPTLILAGTTPISTGGPQPASPNPNTIGGHPFLIDALGFDWTPHVGRAVVVVGPPSSPNLGAKSYIVSNEGGGVAACAPFSYGTPGPGDVVQIMNDATVPQVPIVATPSPPTFQHCDFGSKASHATPRQDGSVGVGAFLTCTLRRQPRCIVNATSCAIIRSGPAAAIWFFSPPLSGTFSGGAIIDIQILAEGSSLGFGDDIVFTKRATVLATSTVIVSGPAPISSITITNNVCAWRVVLTGALFDLYSRATLNMVNGGGVFFYGDHNACLRGIIRLGVQTTVYAFSGNGQGLLNCTCVNTPIGVNPEIAATIDGNNVPTQTSTFSKAQATGFTDAAVVGGFVSPTGTGAMIFQD